MSDADLIRQLGGPAKVADLLGYDRKKGGVQRVQNWLARGIPARVRLDRRDVFESVRPGSAAASGGQHVA